jgi:hypothetical protein
VNATVAAASPYDLFVPMSATAPIVGTCGIVVAVIADDAEDSTESPLLAYPTAFTLNV